MTKLSRDMSSRRLFWRGVPVSSSLRLAYKQNKICIYSNVGHYQTEILIQYWLFNHYFDNSPSHHEILILYLIFIKNSPLPYVPLTHFDLDEEHIHVTNTMLLSMLAPSKTTPSPNILLIFKHASSACEFHSMPHLYGKLCSTHLDLHEVRKHASSCSWAVSFIKCHAYMEAPPLPTLIFMR